MPKERSQALSKKKQDRLKCEPYFEPLSEKVVRETDHIITLDSERYWIHKSDNSRSQVKKKSDLTLATSQRAPDSGVDEKNIAFEKSGS